jgi:hypothetical protein
MTLRSLALILGILPASLLYAQEKHVQDPSTSQELNTRAYIQLLRTDLNAQKEQIIKETMQLDEKQAAVFWPIYKDYESALAKLSDEKLAMIHDYAANFMTMNDEKADQLAQRVMALDDQRNALRRQYYDRMRKSLPAVVVARFFQVDNQIQLLVDLKIASNLPIIEAADQKGGTD